MIHTIYYIDSFNEYDPRPSMVFIQENTQEGCSGLELSDEDFAASLSNENYEEEEHIYTPLSVLETMGHDLSIDPFDFKKINSN